MIPLITILSFSMGFILALILVAIGISKQWIKVIPKEQKYFERIMWVYENNSLGLRDFYHQIKVIVDEYKGGA